VTHVEPIVWKGCPLAYVIRAEMNPERTTFATPEELNLQIGFVVYPSGGEIPRHIHLPLERRVVGTSEALIVQKGRCLVDFYSEEEEFVVTRELRAGDVMLLVAGGHGFRILEDTVLLEVKQGPYTGLEEKRRF
jgi:quercetin dioxygenase-like cupin family protein